MTKRLSSSFNQTINGVHDRERIEVVLDRDGSVLLEHEINHSGDPVDKKNKDERHIYYGNYEIIEGNKEHAKCHISIYEEAIGKNAAQSQNDNSPKIEFEASIDLMNNSIKLSPDNVITSKPCFIDNSAAMMEEKNFF